MSLARTYVNHIQDLAQGKPVRVMLPGQGVVEAVPSIVEGPNGEELVQLHLSLDEKATRVGAIEAQVRMSPETFRASIQAAERMIPRLEAVQQRAAKRLGG